MATTCQIDDCRITKIFARGWCTKHYKRWYRNGNPLVARCAANGDKTRHPLYALYTNIKTRCYNKKSKYYSDYGGRGIIMCERWLGIQGFDNFVEDMGDRPATYSIERIDNDKGYFPENCKWASHFEQSHNRRMFRNNSSGRTGVSARPNGSWQAYIRRAGVHRHLGTFVDKRDAIAARERAEATL